MSDVNFQWLVKLIVCGLGGTALLIWGPPQAQSYGVGLLGAAMGMVGTANSTVTK